MRARPSALTLAIAVATREHASWRSLATFLTRWRPGWPKPACVVAGVSS